MKIIQLHSENIKRIKAIDITPTENIVVLSGKNGHGKTSVLDSIWLALEYRAASKGNPTPLRAGTNKGFVTVDLGDYIVTRKFTTAGTTLEIRTPEGSKIPSPQKLLDGMIGDLSFDPWEFSRKNEKEQREMLADVLYSITEGKLDLADYDIKYQEAFQQRSDLNKEKKRLSTLITQLAPPLANDPTEEVSVDNLTKAISKAVTVEQLVKRGQEIKAAIQRLQDELAIIENEISDTSGIQDIEILKNELENIERNNKRAREVQEYNKIRDGIELVDEEVERINDTMELIAIEKAEALEASPLPVNELKITEDGIRTINEEGHEVPFSQASAAQQLRISLAIAMAANPKLRVIRIADGSLLDDKSMEILKTMADDNNYQCWVEYASRNENDRIGVYIQDGSVESVQD